ncbi:CAP domain-containing protein [Corynebacterium sp. NPDC060344]|uniref:CAP domain-containing protein n=1 Tax=Corynebacterium sp. NPDC060344 TaxID=3347101 RepID=UPI0036466357
MNRFHLTSIAATAAIAAPMFLGATTAGALDFGSFDSGRSGAPAGERPAATAPADTAREGTEPGNRPAAETGTPSDEPATAELQKLHDETNEIRRAAGKAPLAWDQKLAGEAKKWSEQQLREGRMHHDTGQTTGRYNGENVFMTRGGSAADAVQAWRKSPGHYRNMIGDFATQGIGIATDGQGTYYVTQRFNR